MIAHIFAIMWLDIAQVYIYNEKHCFCSICVSKQQMDLPWQKHITLCSSRNYGKHLGTSKWFWLENFCSQIKNNCSNSFVRTNIFDYKIMLYIHQNHFGVPKCSPENIIPTWTKTCKCRKTSIKKDKRKIFLGMGKSFNRVMKPKKGRCKIINQ